MWHVTPSSNVASIEAVGLLLDPPHRNFRTGMKVFLARSEDDARVWAREIARQRGEVTEMALLKVDTTGLVLIGAPKTSVGVEQFVSTKDVHASRIQVHDTFLADPTPDASLG